MESSKNGAGENTCAGAHKWHLRRIHRWLHNKYNLHCVWACFMRYPQKREPANKKIWQQPRPCLGYKLADCWCLLNRQSSPLRTSGAQLHFTVLPLNGLMMLSLDNALPGQMRVGFLPYVNTQRDHKKDKPSRLLNTIPSCCIDWTRGTCIHVADLARCKVAPVGRSKHTLVVTPTTPHPPTPDHPFLGAEANGKICVNSTLQND